MGFDIIPSVEISHRCDFAILADARGYVDAVEIGTDLGIWAREFLSRWHGHWLYLVDDYGPHEAVPLPREVDRMTAQIALAPFHGRYRFIDGRSPEVIPVVLTFIRPSFVYVDGSHDEDDVYADLKAWWDVLPAGGMLAGHDFDPAYPSVMAAVERFAREEGVAVRLTAEPTGRSYYMYRVEPRTLVHRFFRSGEGPNPLATTGG
jgi:hypothetical protein